MKIEIGIGLDSIQIGLLQSELIKILGQPNRINYEERIDYVVLYFNSIMSKFYFDLTSHEKLSSIATINPEVSLYNRRIIGLTKEEIISILRPNGFTSLQNDDYETFDTIYCDEICTTFTFEFNRLREIEFSVLWDDSGNLEKWPDVY